MGKNISIYISDELAEKMENLSEVNWSEVARKGIEDYVETRTHVNIAPILSRLKKEKTELYNQGYKYGMDTAKEIEFLRLERFATSDLRGYWRGLDDYVVDPGTAICAALEKVGVHPPFKTNNTFLQGVKDALLEVYSKVVK